MSGRPALKKCFLAKKAENPVQPLQSYSTASIPLTAVQICEIGSGSMIEASISIRNFLIQRFSCWRAASDNFTKRLKTRQCSSRVDLTLRKRTKGTRKRMIKFRDKKLRPRDVIRGSFIFFELDLKFALESGQLQNFWAVASGVPDSESWPKTTRPRLRVEGEKLRDSAFKQAKFFNCHRKTHTTH